MLEIKNLSFSYPRKSNLVIDDVSLTIENGSVYGLLGPNGAGKSTLLYLIAGLLNPLTGRVYLNGFNTRLRKEATLANMFLVPEEFSLPSIMLSEYVKTQSRYYPRFSMEQMESNLRSFGFEGDFKLSALSMGQKKKIFMCVALAANTPLLLMDEPTNGLDIPGKASFRSFIASNMTDERAIIISTHQVRDVSQILDQVLIMNGNSIVFKSDMYDIIQRWQFLTTLDPALTSKALVSQPDVQGLRIIIPNETGAETEPDLELLFQLVTKHSELITPTAINA